MSEAPEPTPAVGGPIAPGPIAPEADGADPVEDDVTLQRGAGVSVPPPLLFVGFLAAGHVANSVWPWAMWPARLSVTAHVVGWSLAAFGTVVCGWAGRQLRRGDTPILLTRPVLTLVDTGPYRLSRNPMYVSLFLVAIGIVILWNMIWPLIGLPLLWLVLDRWVVRREERHLVEVFGDRYESYQARVRRWF